MLKIVRNRSFPSGRNFLSNRLKRLGLNAIAAGFVLAASAAASPLAQAADGALDTSFGTNGLVTTDFGPGAEGATSVVVQPDGKIVVAGYSSVTDPQTQAKLRFSSWHATMRTTEDWTQLLAQAAKSQPLSAAMREPMVWL